MILPDLNVLVYAFRREAQGHEHDASWLADVVAGGDELALHDLALVGFVRIVTNRRIVPTVTPTVLRAAREVTRGANHRSAGPSIWPLQGRRCVSRIVRRSESMMIR